MSDFAFVVDKIKDRNLEQLQRLSDRSGVPYATVLKVARGYTKNPTSATIEPLVKALKLERSRRKAKRTPRA